MSCKYECHQVGGPWIAENPDCPIHGAQSGAQSEEIYDQILLILERFDDNEVNMYDAADEILELLS